MSPRVLRFRSPLLLAAAASLAACCPCSYAPAGAASTESAAREGATAGGDSSVASVEYDYKSVTILGGGFVTGIIFSEVEKDLIYARTDIGGAYRWNQDDKSWIPITDMLSAAESNYKGIESLAADPVDANRVYMAVGTYTQGWADPGAMMRSEDRGDTWEIQEMPIKMGGNENGRGNGERLAVDPNKNDIILFGSRKYGLWQSSDSGKSWSEGSFPKKEEELGVGITFVTFDKKSGKKGQATPVVYAGWASLDGGLYKSTDGGKTWRVVPGQPKGMMPTHGDFDARGTLYLSYSNSPGPSNVRDGGIWKLDPKTGAFTDITPLRPKKSSNPEENDEFGYGGLSAIATATGTVMVTTLERWGPGDEIFRTVDGGTTWHQLGEKAVLDDAGAEYLKWGKETLNGRGWAADIAIDPFDPNRAMYVTGQGVWATEDAGQAEAGKPTHWRFSNQNLEETAVKEIVSPPSGPPLLSVMGDICGFRHDNLDTPSPTGMFDNPICGSGYGLDVAWLKPEIVARVGTTSWGKEEDAHGAVSKDGGKTWIPFVSEPKGKGAGSVAVAADGSSLLWVPKGGKAAISKDLGKTWTLPKGLPEPAELPDWAPTSLRVAADRVNAKKYYIYDAVAGKAYFSEDSGRSFQAGDSGLPALPEYALTPAALRAVPGKEGRVWITTGQDLYRSSDSGKTYEYIDGVSESQAIGFGKPAEGSNEPTIFLVAKVAEHMGIYRSVDAGESWVRINTDRQRFGGVGLITGDPKQFGRVYLGTHGRGIMYGDPLQ